MDFIHLEMQYEHWRMGHVPTYPCVKIQDTSQYTPNCNGAISCDEGRFPEAATASLPPSLPPSLPRCVVSEYMLEAEN